MGQYFLLVQWKKTLSTQVFSCEICKIFRTAFFFEKPQLTETLLALCFSTELKVKNSPYFADILKITCSQIFREFHRETPVLESILNTTTLLKRDCYTSVFPWLLRNF